MYIFYNKAA